jgi:hypothetical protein
MNQKIIIKSDDFSREIFSFLKEVGAGMTIDWKMEALDRLRNAVIEAFEKMGVTLEIDARLQSASFPSLTKRGPELECLSEKPVLRLKRAP